MKIKDEQVFSVPAENFAVSASNSGFTLGYSADGNTFTPWTAATPANETLIVSGSAKGCLYKLIGNVGDVFIQW